MTVLFFVLYLLAGVCFGLAFGGVHTRRLNQVSFLAAGLFLWVAVDLIQSLQKL